MRFSEVRSLGSALLLFAALGVLRPGSLRLRRHDLLLMAAFGVLGIALGQLLFFRAIERLDIGVAMVIVYLAPIFVATWSRFVRHELVRRRLWLALALSLAGLVLVVDLWSGITVDRVGLVTALAGALAFAAYVISAGEGMERGRDPVSFVAWGFFFATLFWSLAQPWWSFPTELVDRDISLLGRLAELSAPVWLLLGLSIVLGTTLPFILFVGALRHLSPTTTILFGTLEPVFAALIAFAWLGEELTAQQAVGGSLVLCAVVVAQTARSPVLSHAP